MPCCFRNSAVAVRDRQLDPEGRGLHLDQGRRLPQHIVSVGREQAQETTRDAAETAEGHPTERRGRLPGDGGPDLPLRSLRLVQEPPRPGLVTQSVAGKSKSGVSANRTIGNVTRGGESEMTVETVETDVPTLARGSHPPRPRRRTKTRRWPRG